MPERACGSSDVRKAGHQSFANFEATASTALPPERSGCADSLARRRALEESAPEAHTRARLPRLRRTGLSGTGKAGSGTTHVLPPRGPYSIGIFKIVRQ